MKITALINTYNYGRYIEEAIESVLRQDYPATEMEIVLVDDGSTDDTRKRVATFGERVRYIYQENAGQGAAINRGYQEARGEIIALLDADDLWAPNKARRMVEEFEQRPKAGLLLHRMTVWESETNQRGPDPYFGACEPDFPMREADARRFPSMPTSAVCFRRELAQPVFPLPLRLTMGFNDAFLAYAMAFLAPAIILDEPLATYRIHGNNLGHGQDLRGEAKGSGNRAAIERRVKCNRALIEELEKWYVAHGFSLEDPAIHTLLLRSRIAEQEYRFQLVGATRAELLAYRRDLKELDNVGRPLGYRMFRALSTAAAAVLGYRAYTALRGKYGENRKMMGWREKVVPSK